MQHTYSIATAPVIVWVHLFVALTSLVLGAVVLIRRKGTPTHRRLGRVWAALMYMAATTSFWIQARDHFSVIHVLSVIMLISLTYALYAIRRGRVKTHKICMQSTYAGLIGAGVFTLLPYRMLGQWVFG